MPLDTETLMRAAARAHREGRLDEAVRIAQEILKQKPGNLEALLLLGVVMTKIRRFEVAIPALTQVTAQDASAYHAFYWLSTAHRWAGNLNEAQAAAERAVALNPKEPQALHQLGVCCIDLQKWQAAEAAFQVAAKLAPEVGPIQFNLGVALEELGRRDEAMRAFRRAVALNPQQIEALYRMGQSLAHELDFHGAAEYAERILKLNGNSPQGHLLIGIACVGLNRPSEAADHLAKALELRPDDPETLTLFGTILQATGRLEEADHYLLRSIEIEPRQGYPYYAIARTRKFRESDQPFVDDMERVAASPDLSRRHHGDLEYALGKVSADLGNYESAMSHYNLANQIVRSRRLGTESFDRRSYQDGVSFAVQNIDKGFIERYSPIGSSDDTPIFVVGMIRSGTTLAEQILSSHPSVGAAGEQRFWMDNRATALDPPGNVVNSVRLRDLVKKYLELLREVCPGESRIVDKMPGNYAQLGMIHVAFPNAKIIHMRRNPVDTCLSIWTTPNSSPIDWANDKSDVVFVYREYLRIMEHWRQSLPANRLLEIDYEGLVADPDGVSRQMVDFCALPWDDKCLHPEDNTRAVATPSNWQVRQPIYKSAVERWRPYEPWLEEFSELLTEA